MRYVELLNSIELTKKRINTQKINAWYCSFWESVCSVKDKHKHCKVEEIGESIEALRNNIETDLAEKDYFEEIDEEKDEIKAALVIINYVNNFKKEN